MTKRKTAIESPSDLPPTLMFVCPWPADADDADVTYRVWQSEGGMQWNFEHHMIEPCGHSLRLRNKTTIIVEYDSRGDASEIKMQWLASNVNDGAPPMFVEFTYERRPIEVKTAWETTYAAHGFFIHEIYSRGRRMLVPNGDSAGLIMQLEVPFPVTVEVVPDPIGGLLWMEYLRSDGVFGKFEFPQDIRQDAKGGM